jgi:hypothetical protein
MIPVSQTSETNKYLSFLRDYYCSSSIVLSCRTFDGYVESEIILPIVALLSGLRQNSRYPILKYQLTLNPDGNVGVICRWCCDPNSMSFRFRLADDYRSPIFW